MRVVYCRARVSEGCYHGRPAKGVYVNDPREDGTYDPRTDSVICDSCFVLLMPMTPGGMGRREDLQAAIIAARKEHSK